jgi:hypothetical protein
MNNVYSDPGGLDSKLYLIKLGEYLNPHSRWTVSRIVTWLESDRRKGAASRTLKLVCADADREGAVLRLAAAPFDSRPSALTRDELRNWYIRNGFMPIDKDRVVLERNPR